MTKIEKIVTKFEADVSDAEAQLAALVVKAEAAAEAIKVAHENAARAAAAAWEGVGTLPANQIREEIAKASAATLDAAVRISRMDRQ